MTEPDNATGAELCAVANASEPTSGAWGWADTSCDTAAPFLCEIPACGSYTYCAESTGYNYTLTTCRASYSEAEGSCRLQGGHLASYASQQEQEEVEQYFAAQRLLVGSYQGAYWLGAKVRSAVACSSPGPSPGPAAPLVLPGQLATSAGVCGACR